MLKASLNIFVDYVRKKRKKKMTSMTGHVKDTGIFFQCEIKISRCELAGERRMIY